MKHIKTVWTALMLAAVMALGLGLAACGTPQFTVTFESNGGSAVAAVTVDKDGKVEKPADPTKEDCIFDGWFKDATFGESWNFDTDTVTGDVTLYAKWTPLADCAVTFDSQGGSAVQSATVKAGKTLTKPTDPTRARFRFDGWFKDAAGETAWNFDTDTVTGDITLYAKWTQIEAGEIAWVKPAAGSVIIPDDIGLFNPDYRKTLEDLAPDVYATEDGERLATIVVDTDADFGYDAETNKLTPGSYTVTYETRDSMNESHEETFDVVVKSAEEINYYVYANQDKSGKSAVCGIDFSAAVGGVRIRVAHDKYFEVTDVDNLPEAIRNPHAEGKIIDFDDPFIIKNADDEALTLNTADAMAEYTVFDSHGVVVFGWNGANGRGVDENNRYTLGKNGGINATTVTVPAGGYVLIVGYTAGGNWYGKTETVTVNGKPEYRATSADAYWGTKAADPGVPQYDMDGRQFASTGFNYRWKNVVQLKKGADVLTGEYVNQAPYMTKGYNGFDILRSDMQLTEEELKAQILAAIGFRDDAGTFDVTDDIDVVAANISLNATDIAAIDNTVEAQYTDRIEVTDSTDATQKAEYSIVVTIADKYLKIGDSVTWANPTVVKNAKLTSSPGDGKLYVWDSTATADNIHEHKYTGCAVINKNTGKIIASADWSNYYDHSGVKKTLKDGLGITTGDGKYAARTLFTNYMTDAGRTEIAYTDVAKEDLLILVVVQGGTENHKTYGQKFNTCCDAGYANAYVEIKGLTGLSNTAKPVTE